MRLISAIVRNYRLHRELSVEFDRARTVIGGPNESGKSTLAEAIHRALFFPAKSGAEPQKRMRSSSHLGHPEVELVFEAGGRRYQLKKRFSGATGTTMLTPHGGAPLPAEEAETELARLLGVSSDTKAKASTSQWAHLWVEQGKSAEDPADHVSSQRDALVSRLQDMGGAAAMQSPLDTRVASRFASLVGEYFVQSGKTKVGSALARAEEDARAAESARTEAAERLARLRQAIDDFEDAAQTIVSAADDLKSLSEERKKLEDRRTRISDLNRTVENEVRTGREAANHFETLEKAHRRIAELHEQIAAFRAELNPQQTKLEKLERQSVERRDRVREAEKASNQAAAARRSAQQRRDLFGIVVTYLEKKAELAETDGRIKQARGIEAEIASMRAELAKLPAIEGAGLKTLQKAETKLSQADASLNAMATGIEFLAGDLPVKVGTSTLEPGSSLIVTEDSEISVGPSVRLRVRPGGGTTLGEARRGVAELQKKLQHGLDSHGVPTLAAAVEAVTRRDALDQDIKAAEARLADFALEALVEKQTSLAEACAAAEAEIQRRQKDIPDFVSSADLLAARANVAAADKALETAEAADKKHQAARDAALSGQTEIANALEEHARKLNLRKSEVAKSEVELDLSVKSYGDEATRGRTFAEARHSKDEAAAAVRKTREALAALQPELLEGARSRVARAIEEKSSARNDAEKRQAVAQDKLVSDGSVDPHAELAQCDARFQAATERLASVRTHAEAIRLLHQLFSDEQRALADQFTRPLADKISGYLQCLFGADARAVIALHDNAFSGLELVRATNGGGAVAFDFLSGGTREQLAAAVRLAMAEVLAEDHNGCLPVVFDDSFAYSDPNRVRTLQDMLDLGARRGLQIIVLTCNPADYAGLGARPIDLRVEAAPPTSVAVHPAPGGSNEGPDDETGVVAIEDSPVSDDQRQQLIDALRSRRSSSGNTALRQALGWEEQTYDLVKRDLIARRVIVPGKGRGGSVSLLEDKPPPK